MALLHRRLSKTIASSILTLSLAGFTLPACASDFRLAVAETGMGKGDIGIPGVQCSFGSSDLCIGQFPAGATVTLTATPAPGSLLAGWSGDCSGASGPTCTLTMDGDKDVLAKFDLVVPAVLLGDQAGTGVSINSLGEAVWSQIDSGTGKSQIFSSQRGQLTSDPWSHDHPAVNSLGDVVWVATGDPSTGYSSVQGIIAGAPVKQASSPAAIQKVDINDRREVIWTETDGYGSHIISSQRGMLTSPIRNSYGQSINNRGDVVFLENDYQFNDNPQVFKIAADTVEPVQVTTDLHYHYDASINDNGDVAWSESDSSGTHRIVSTKRGELLKAYYPLRGVDIDNCGDLVYTSLDPATLTGSAFRLGNSSPCATVNGTHETMEQAAPVAYGDIFTAVADSQSAPVSWYRFDAAAGDTVYVTINYDGRAPNLLRAQLLDSQGAVGAETRDSDPVPRAMTMQVSSSGTYFLKVDTQGQFGYSVSLSKYPNNCGPGPCREELVKGQIDSAAINALGEYVWSAFDNDFSTTEIYSSRRGKLTSDFNAHEYPAINDLGDVVWSVLDFESPYPYKIEGIIDGRKVTVAAGMHYMLEPAINNRREVVWSETDDSGVYQIQSSLRGQLTTSATQCREPRIDTVGNVVFVTTVPTGPGNRTQVMKIAAGSSTPTALTDDQLFRVDPVLIDSGEMIWLEKDPITMAGSLKSTSRGVLIPAADMVPFADMNRCGDVLFATVAGVTTTLWRMGENAPCVSFPGTHDTRETAAAVAMGDVFTGAADASGTATWYRFEAGAGETISIGINYDGSASNVLEIGLYDAQENLVSGPTSSAPLAIVTTAPGAGSYFLKVAGSGGKIGYTVNVANKPFVMTPRVPEYPLPFDAYGSASINSLGEVLYTKNDDAGITQIFSTLRGQLTADPVTHSSPVQNDLGDLAWVERDCSTSPCTNTVKAIIAGQQSTIASWQGWMIVQLAISNDGEVVWSQDDGYPGRRVYSSKRGALTAAVEDCGDADINNRGDVVYAKYGVGWSSITIYLLRAGSSTPEVVTGGGTGRPSFPRINDNGEIIWVDNGMMYSNLRGQLPLQNSGSIVDGDINNCGDIVYQGTTPNYYWSLLYRYGNSAPCVSYPGDHGSIDQAASVAVGETAVALADTAPVTWYRFEGTEGDTIHVRVGYDKRAPNSLVFALYDAAGNLVAGPAAPGQGQVDYSVPAGGVYFVRVETQGGRFGYAVSVQRSAVPVLKLTVAGESDGYFASFAALFGIDSQAEELKLFCRSGDITEDVTINKCSKTVTINGGYDAGFATPSGKTRLTGKLRLTCGKLVVDRLALR